jgi:hypothetical protein
LFNWVGNNLNPDDLRQSCRLNVSGVLNLKVQFRPRNVDALFYASASGNVYMSCDLFRINSPCDDLQSLGITPQQQLHCYYIPTLQDKMETLKKETKEADEKLETAARDHEETRGEYKNKASVLSFPRVSSIDALRSVLNTNLVIIQRRAENMRSLRIPNHLITEFVIAATKYVRIQLKYYFRFNAPRSGPLVLLRGQSDGDSPTPTPTAAPLRRSRSAN